MMLNKERKNSDDNLKKICHLSTVHSVNDTRIFYRECRSLKQHGYDVHLVISDNRDRIVDGVRIHALNESKNRFYRMAVSPLFAFIKGLKTGANIFHFHDPELIPVGLLLKLFNKKVIYDVHENYTEAVLRKRWIRIRYIRKIFSFIIGIFERAGILFFDSVIAATPSIENNLNSKKTVLVRNFPIYAMFNFPEAGKKINDPEIILIYIGILTRDRGIKEIVRAMDLIREKAELWLLGTWDNPEFKIECGNDPGWNYVRYFGYLKPERAYEYLLRADIGLVNFLPVENHIDSMPNKPFEYMAAGLPIVMSDFPLWNDLFKGCALFVDAYNPDDIAGKILSLIENKNLRTELGLKGRRLIEEQYSWEKESEKLIELYDKLSNRV